MRTLPQYWCNDCDEFRQVDIGIGRKFCVVCANELEARIIPGAEERSNDDLNGLLDVLGADFRALIEQSMSEQAPSRQISRTYLASLGKVIVDERQGILHDIGIEMGPFKFMGVPASGFGGLPPLNQKISAKIVLANPECGESPFTNQADMQGAIVYLSRGKVSFATKAKYAIEAGAVVVIIGQTTDIWPFIMCDGSTEFNLLPEFSHRQNTPILMISKRDSLILHKFLLQNESLTRTTITTSTDAPTIASISCYFTNGESSECCICKDEMQVGCEVLKLHCRHIYHTSCVEAWLESQNTCPMCRAEMPIDENPKPSKAQREAISEEAQHRMPYFT